jgi:hypothetical protein
VPNFEPWIPIVAPVATVFAAFLAAIPFYLQTNLKRKEEIRLTRAGQAEADVRLCTLFVQLMAKAHNRSEWTVADAAVQAAINSEGPLAPTSTEAFRDLIQAAVVYPAGLSEQLAAISAVAELGVRYDLLCAPGLVGLESVASWWPPPIPPVLTAAIETLKAKSRTA